VAKFEAQTDQDWPTNAWSLALSLEGTPDESWTQTALVRFLANEENAHAQWLQPRSRFDLFEGRRKVAEGTVVEFGD
jgi:hypothetical protein